MPLDPIARRYAETLLTDAVEESARKLQEDFAKLGQNQPMQTMVLSGVYVAELANVYLEQIRFLTEARMNSLIKAYEKSGLAFDEATFNEIKNEVTQFCHQKQHNAVSAIRQFIPKTFHGSHPPGVEQAVVEQIIRGVDGIKTEPMRSLIDLWLSISDCASLSP